jgi:hypothetical protein
MPIKIVRRSTGVVLRTYNMLPNGNHLLDQGKVYVE